MVVSIIPQVACSCARTFIAEVLLVIFVVVGLEHFEILRSKSIEEIQFFAHLDREILIRCDHQVSRVSFRHPPDLSFELRQCVSISVGQLNCTFVLWRRERQIIVRIWRGYVSINCVIYCNNIRAARGLGGLGGLVIFSSELSLLELSPARDCEVFNALAWLALELDLGLVLIVTEVRSPFRSPMR